MDKNAHIINKNYLPPCPPSPNTQPPRCSCGELYRRAGVGARSYILGKIKQSISNKDTQKKTYKVKNKLYPTYLSTYNTDNIDTVAEKIKHRQNKLS